MSKFDNQLDRMNYLMGYDNHINESKKKSGIEYHTTGADGKEYGIIREGISYYIKTSTPEKANIAESYDYINGYDYRKENRFNSYNEATKQLELKLMNLNESKGIHKDVTVANTNSSNEAFQGLTEASRKELDRMHMIFENSFISKDNIGNHGDPESKGTSSPANTTKNAAPYSEKATPEMNRDNKTNASKDKACKDCKKVGEPKMDNLKNPKGGTAINDKEKAKVDLDGESVATIEKKGAKAVKINESSGNPFKNATDEPETTDIDAMLPTEEPEAIENGESVDSIAPDGEELVGDPETDEMNGDLDGILREYEEIYLGDNDTLEGKQNLKGSDSPMTTDTIDGKNPKTECSNGCEKALKGEKGSLPVQTWDKMNEGKVKLNKKKINESIDRITETVYNNLVRENIKNKVKAILSEEMTHLNAWGKHPKYGKPFMSMPDNKEVYRGTADRDWNDDSTKGNAPYGRKRGSNAPFDDKSFNLLVDNVLETVKESIYGKK